jgi:hypothetical protein
MPLLPQGGLQGILHMDLTQIRRSPSLVTLQARVLHHEAAGVSAAVGTPVKKQGAGTAPDTAAASISSGSNTGTRSQLLSQALLHAERAAELEPSSLSCAGLRAALLINLLIEQSGQLGAGQHLGLPPLTGQAGNAACTTLDPSTATVAAAAALLDSDTCEALRSRFAATIAACSAALSCAQPMHPEPLIMLHTASHATHDPCLLQTRDSDQLRQWVGSHANCEAVVAEKRAAVGSMQQVLTSCHALLDSRQVPAENIIRLLQHIMR